MSEDEVLYTLTEVAQKTKISMPTLQRYKKLYQDRIPSHGKGRSQRYPEEALEVFLLNVALYPEAANPYDSLGEAYMIMGEKDLAIINYAKSLQFDHGNKNATEMIQKLQADEE